MGVEDGYEYLFGIKNELTANTNAMVVSLTQLQLSLQKTDSAARRAESGLRAAGTGAHGGAHAAASGISYLVRGFDDLARGGKYAANGLLDVGKAASRLGPILAGIAVAGGLAALAKYSFEVSEAKEQTIDAFSVFQGSGAQGARTFRALDDLAANVHAPAEKVQGLAKELLELGLDDQAALTQTVRAVTELQRVGLESGANKLKSIVERSLAAGHFVLGKGGKQLAGTGVNEEDLARSLGLPSAKALDKQMKAGKITVEEGIAALDHAIIAGKVGALSTKKFTVSDAFTDLHNSIRGLFQEADTGPLTEALRNLTQDFAEGTDGATAMKQTVDAITHGVALLVDLADGIGTAFSSAFKTAKDAAMSAYEFMIKHDPRLTAKESAEKLERLHYGLRMNENSALSKRQLEARDRIQEMARSGASVHELGLMAKKLGVEVTLVDRPKSLDDPKAAAAFRQQIADISGKTGETPIHDMRTPLHQAGKQAAASIDKGFRDEAKMHSPSAVMMDLGAESFDSLRAGHASAMDRADTSPAMSGPSSAGRSGPVVHVDVGGIHVHGSTSDADFLPLLESQIADVFERAALELGQ